MERAPTGDAECRTRDTISRPPALRADELRPLDGNLIVNATKGVLPIGERGL